MSIGRRTWRQTIAIGDVWKNSDLTFHQQRDMICHRILNSGWLTPGHAELRRVVDNLANADGPDEWDQWWNELYDHADAEGVWIDLWSSYS